jgi:hypothetical protein
MAADPRQPVPPRPSFDYGFFVLTMSRDLYMAKHRPYTPEKRTEDGRILLSEAVNGFYHSAYVGGEPVVCSGTMLIQMGLIKAIRFNSGHYQPHANNYRALLMALRMWAVPLDRVVFEDFNGWLIGFDPSKTVQDAGIGTLRYVLQLTDSKLKLLTNRDKTKADNKTAYAARPAANPNAVYANEP